MEPNSPNEPLQSVTTLVECKPDTPEQNCALILDTATIPVRIKKIS